MTKPKFKVGDRVRVIRNKEHTGEIYHYAHPGDPGVIRGVCGSLEPYPCRYDVSLPETANCSRQTISETCLEFADGPIETKSSMEDECIRKLKAFMDSF